MYKMNLYMFWFIFLLFMSIMFFIFGLNFMYLDKIVLIDYEFYTLNGLIFSMTFLLDVISLFFMSCVLFISSMVLFYSYMYMYNDIYMIRFMYLILLFILSMLMLIISPNLISILIGWDGLGLISYCLIVYFQNNNSYNSGMLTILVNRVGDVMILLSIAWFINYGSWHYYYYVDKVLNGSNYILIMMITASFTKSAQIPFSSWLPAAMAAPTPVSALVHSSTLVTAGIYLMIRFSDLIYFLNCNLFIYLSMMTMVMAGLVANFEYDLKKIIALSTLSQLGLMMTIMFFGYPMLSYFHLLTHAFFKSLLFLCAGLIIHLMNNCQDIRYMGGLYNQIPLTMSCFLLSNFSLIGFPFMSGFYSKDMILELSFFNSFNFYFIFMMYFSVGLTTSYTFRLIYYLMFNSSNFFSMQLFVEDNYMFIPMIILGFMSLFSGSLLSWLIMVNPMIMFLSFEMKLLSLFMIFVGLLMGMMISLYKYNYNNYQILIFMNSMWFMSKLNSSFINLKFMKLTNLINNKIELGWGEQLMSKELYNFIIMLSQINQKLHYNYLKLYFISFILMIFILLIYLSI